LQGSSAQRDFEQTASRAFHPFLRTAGSSKLLGPSLIEGMVQLGASELLKSSKILLDLKKADKIDKVVTRDAMSSSARQQRFLALPLLTFSHIFPRKRSFFCFPKKR